MDEGGARVLSTGSCKLGAKEGSGGLGASPRRWGEAMY
jgi:hypothetical protein